MHRVTHDRTWQPLVVFALLLQDAQRIVCPLLCLRSCGAELVTALAPAAPSCSSSQRAIIGKLLLDGVTQFTIGYHSGNEVCTGVPSQLFVGLP